MAATSLSARSFTRERIPRPSQHSPDRVEAPHQPRASCLPYEGHGALGAPFRLAAAANGIEHVATLRPAVVLHWFHLPFAEPEVKRDIDRFVVFLGCWEGSRLDGLETGRPFQLIAVDRRRRARRVWLPPAWQGVNPTASYNLLLNGAAFSPLDRRCLPSEGSKVPRRSLRRALARARSKQTTERRSNIPTKIADMDAGTVEGFLPGSDVVDWIEETGRPEIAPHHLPVVVGWSGDLVESWPVASAGALDALFELASFRRVAGLVERRAVGDAVALVRMKLGRRRRTIMLAGERPFWELLHDHDGDNGVIVEAETGGRGNALYVMVDGGRRHTGNSRMNSMSV